jgi:hypothetical protein
MKQTAKEIKPSNERNLWKPMQPNFFSINQSSLQTQVQMESGNKEWSKLTMY